MGNNDFHLSFEFFPVGKRDEHANLLNSAKQLNQFSPDLYTITNGALGNTYTNTLETLLAIREATPTPTGAHLAGSGKTKSEISTMLDTYRHERIEYLLALRGDRPSDMQDLGDFHYGIDVVKFIREHSNHYFQIIVAAYPEYHPEAANPHQDFEHFQNKVNAGANYAFSQYFFNPDAYFHFIDQCEAARITIPIIPGIMPITNYKHLARFSDAYGIEIPRWIRQKLAYYDAKEDTTSLEAFGIDVVTLLCYNLLENGAPGLHFYTMNRAKESMSILQNLGF